MQRISWPQHDMSKQKWLGVVSNDLFEHRHCFGLRSQGCFLPAKKNYGGRPSIWSTWGFGAFQSKRNCLRDRSGNPNKNMVLVESLGGVFFLDFCWLKTSEICVLLQWTCIGDIDAGNNPGKPWDDMICQMKVDVIVICIIYFFRSRSKPDFTCSKCVYALHMFLIYPYGIMLYFWTTLPSLKLTVHPWK